MFPLLVVVTATRSRGSSSTIIVVLRSMDRFRRLCKWQRPNYKRFKKRLNGAVTKHHNVARFLWFSFAFCFLCVNPLLATLTRFRREFQRD